MTPREIAQALDADPIAGITHGLGTDMRGIGVDGLEPDPYLYLRAGLTEVYLYVNADDLGEVIAVARHAKVFRVEAKTLRADLVEIMAWSLNASHPDPAAPVFKVIEVEGDEEGDATALYYPTLAPGDYPYRALPVDGEALGRPILPYVLYHLEVNGQMFNPFEGEELVEGTLGIAISYSCLHHGVITNPSYPRGASLLSCLLQEDAIYRNSFGGVSPASLTPDRLISKEGLRRARLARELSQRMGDQELLSKAASLFNAAQGERIYPENPDDWHIVYDQN